MHVEFLDGVDEEDGHLDLLAAVSNFEVDLRIAARTVKQPAVIHTNLKPMLYVSKSPPIPAPIMVGVMPGTAPNAVALLCARSPMKAGSEEIGRPRGRTAPAILGPRLAVNLAVKIALSATLAMNWKAKIKLTNG